MTTHFELDGGTITNNDSESHNQRMKKRLGDHPNLPKFLGALKERKFEKKNTHHYCRGEGRGGSGA